jgi:integrase
MPLSGNDLGNAVRCFLRSEPKAMNATHEAVAPTVVRAFPTAPNRGDLTVREVIDAYMATYTGADTARAQRVGYWQDTLGDVKLRDLDSDTIADVLDQFAAQPVRKYIGRDARGRRLYRDHHQRSGKTVNRYHTTLSAVLTWAKQKRLTPKGWHNPCHDVKGAPEGAGRVRFLSADERDRLLKVARISAWPKLYLLILMAITTGARRGELLGLRFRDLRLPDEKDATGTATLPRTKNGDARVLVLTPAVCAEIKRHGVGVPEALLFPGKFRRDQPYAIEEAWRRAMKNARIENFTFHDLRHTHASYLAQSGASLLEIADSLGHRTMAMVKRYSHLSTDSKARLIGRVLGNIGEAA